MTQTMTPAQEIQAEARQMFREALKVGEVYTGAALAEQFGRKPRWGQERISEVRAEEETQELLPGEVEIEGLESLEETPGAHAPQSEAQISAEEPRAAIPQQTNNGNSSHESARAEKEPQGQAQIKAYGVRAAARAMFHRPPKAHQEHQEKAIKTWPVYLLLVPAMVAIWGGWVELGEKTGFGEVNLLPGIGDGLYVNTAVTLPIGMEVYAAYALYVWLSGRVTGATKRFAMVSALAALILGSLGQAISHLLTVAGVETAPGWVTVAVSAVPVAVVGMGAGLAHMVVEDRRKAHDSAT